MENRCEFFHNEGHIFVALFAHKNGGLQLVTMPLEEYRCGNYGHAVKIHIDCPTGDLHVHSTWHHLDVHL